MLKRSLTGIFAKPNKFQNLDEYLSFAGDYDTKVSRLEESPALLSKINDSNRLQ